MKILHESDYTDTADIVLSGEKTGDVFVLYTRAMLKALKEDPIAEKYSNYIKAYKCKYLESYHSPHAETVLEIFCDGNSDQKNFVDEIYYFMLMAADFININKKDDQAVIDQNIPLLVRLFVNYLMVMCCLDSAMCKVRAGAFGTIATADPYYKSVENDMALDDMSMIADNFNGGQFALLRKYTNAKQNFDLVYHGSVLTWPEGILEAAKWQDVPVTIEMNLSIAFPGMEYEPKTDKDQLICDGVFGTSAAQHIYKENTTLTNMAKTIYTLVHKFDAVFGELDACVNALKQEGVL